MTVRPLTLEDIADQRAYERERDAFRREVIAVKKRRRVAIGPVVTVLFENRTTVRFQVQEMARAERLTTDEQVQHELDVYNRLLPGAGELSATVFLELTGEEQLRAWLPRLVGIERSLVLGIVDGRGPRSVRSVPEGTHGANLTRAQTTSSVHYVRFPCPPAAAAAVAAGPLRLSVDHLGYPEGRDGVVLSGDTRAELAADLAGG